MPNAIATLEDHLGSTPDLAARVALISASVPGRIAFSTSLGMEDQAVLHGIAETVSEPDANGARRP